MTLRPFAKLCSIALAAFCAPAWAGLLDFDSAPGASEGPVPNPITIDGVNITFSGCRFSGRAPNPRSSCDSSPDAAWLYDSQGPDGRDPDLEGPFYNAALRPGLEEARDDFGLMLIVNEFSDAQDPDDNGRGGILNVFFDQAVSLLSMDILDVGENRGEFTFEMVDALGNILSSGTNQYDSDNDGGNNFYEHVVFGTPGDGVDGVRELRLILDDTSGAIDNIAFSVGSVNVPAPPVALLLALGLLAAGARSRTLGLRA